MLCLIAFRNFHGETNIILLCTQNRTSTYLRRFCWTSDVCLYLNCRCSNYIYFTVMLKYYIWRFFHSNIYIKLQYFTYIYYIIFIKVFFRFFYCCIIYLLLLSSIHIVTVFFIFTIQYLSVISTNYTIFQLIQLYCCDWHISTLRYLHCFKTILQSTRYINR